ncbi:hypothetical protein GCM10010284_00400 [Streptomyces rubiginosohelvolus]|uniref:Uncharacterized protein n=1 Tax=Streptomyces rubiginosohelvolus TaxID=67362 RepID=A0ABQ3BFS3_9ACTN|nr:hypothetical protein GCM10010284_00400 [Streptomyces rubiginosohelvolus]GGZ35978.1 hypothetical protein GCM10010328_06810 [Streptomyces pluricolorescens]
MGRGRSGGGGQAVVSKPPAVTPATKKVNASAARAFSRDGELLSRRLYGRMPEPALRKATQ